MNTANNQSYVLVTFAGDAIAARELQQKMEQAGYQQIGDVYESCTFGKTGEHDMRFLAALALQPGVLRVRKI